MSIVKYRPWSALSSIQDELNKAFGENLSLLNEEVSNNRLSSWTPHVDIKEEEKNFVVLADIPGVDPKDIKVNMDENILTIQGNRHSETKDNSESYSKIERFSGSFCRQFTLPSNIDKEKIKAKSKNGVLELTLPKTTAGLSKAIKVEVE